MKRPYTCGGILLVTRRLPLHAGDYNAGGLCRRACVAIGELNSETVIGTPDYTAVVDASVRGNANLEFIRDGGHRHASNSRAAIG
jgi:hypothetical protein